jgi:hypothetical protein
MGWLHGVHEKFGDWGPGSCFPKEMGQNLAAALGTDGHGGGGFSLDGP